MRSKITLLDNSVWDVKELEERMIDDSFYYGYLAKNVLSSSSIKDLYSKPKDYSKNLGKDISYIPAIRMGQLIHTLILEPQKIASDYKFVESSSRRTMKYQDIEFNNPTKKVMLQSELDEANDIKDHIDLDVKASDYFAGGKAEVPKVGVLFGIPFRCKADYLKENELVDLKTTSNLEEWEYDAKHKWHYDIQAYIYTTLFKIPKMKFVVVDKKTKEVDVFSFTKTQMQIAELKLRIAIHNYMEEVNG